MEDLFRTSRGGCEPGANRRYVRREAGDGRASPARYPVPDGSDPDEYLSRLCWEGFKRLYPRPTPQAEERLAYELEVIRLTQFANYFLVVWDIIVFVQESNILFGVRGSAAASLALYCLGVTEVDPLEYRLVFERFLNLERKEMPDIDMDFQDDRRDEVLAYVTGKYGKDRVAQIITFGTLGAKASLRDVGRSLGMGYGDVDRSGPAWCPSSPAPWRTPSPPTPS